MAVTLWIEDGRNTPLVNSGGRPHALIAAFAERHVALTLDMAEALAELEGADAPAEVRLWGAGFRLAGEAVGQARTLGATRFWQASVPSFMTTVAEPLLRKAMQRCGAVALPGQTPLGASPTGNWQTSYRAQLDALLLDMDGMGQGFWAEAALRLYGSALHTVQARRTGPTHFEPEPLLVRLLFENEPILPEAARLSRRLKRVRNKSQRKRSGARPKEGGVTGLRSSTSLEDLNDALMSELVLPPPMLADRILHEGLLVRHRPPYRQPRRDVLMITLADRREARDRDAAAIIKAAWADAALRLQILLAQIGLEKSDLVWSEIGKAGHSAAVLRVETQDFPSGLDPLLMEGAVRRMRLFRSDLMPGLVDTLSSVQGDVPDAEEPAAVVWSGMAKAALRQIAMTGHREPRSSLHATQAPRPMDYARRIALVTFPSSGPLADQARGDAASVRSNLSAALRTTLEEDFDIIGFIPPEGAMSRGAVFSLAGSLIPGGSVDLAIDDDLPAGEAVGRLVGAMSAEIISAVLEAINAR
ncbi:hypothetical protein [Allosediminivita pacifica]|uniref:Uncharacterized protein n=1 Tax=Allosediminivita pacifica TaxID=1267769 RepID=A0A2T6A5E4_9RHOB|nr:hypothetical protein [Allosediminivita pacifica]PTX39015.1 hypothetical protein C8N44_1408 [Allosediminivita pacifica]GGB28446.1 hypothetical protein GCM10011324_42680 [Allosediminivita pacifica]